jgi:hypothetical protein
MLFLWSLSIRPNDICLRSPVLDSFAQQFLQRGCYVRYCVVLNLLRTGVFKSPCGKRTDLIRQAEFNLQSCI